MICEANLSSNVMKTTREMLLLDVWGDYLYGTVDSDRCSTNDNSQQVSPVSQTHPPIVSRTQSRRRVWRKKRRRKKEGKERRRGIA